MSVEIYICDLKPEVQEQVLSELNLSSDKDGNYDLFPLFVVEKPECIRRWPAAVGAVLNGSGAAAAAAS